MERFLFFLAFLVAWIAFGAVVAAGAGLVIGSFAAFFTRHVSEGRQEVIRAARWFPFKCLMWLVIVFLFYRVVNVAVRHNTSIRGDAWTCQLPNGYALSMIDWTDAGWVYDARIQGFGVIESIGDQEGSVSGVRVVQIAGRYILGGSDSQLGEHVGTNSDYVDAYFVLDTQTRKHRDFPSYDALRNSAAQLGIPLKLERIYDVYKRYRFTWFDLAVALIAFLPPLVFGWLLLDRIVRLRKTIGNVLRPA
jgi:hypothetical protein